MSAVYGATGYTGRVVAAELRRTGVEARLCGRNGDKLRALVRDMGVDWETRAASVDDRPALETAFEGCDAVISCAGPFTYYGAPVLEAALEAGAHFLDTTGEQPYIRGVFEHYDGPARERGLAVLPAAAFDYVPGDLACALAARDREPLREVVVAYALSGLGVTRGTMHSAVEMLSGGDVEYRGGQWRPAVDAPRGELFDFGGALGRRLVTKYPGGELITVPRHLDVQAVRERITASSLAPHSRLSGVVAASSGVLRTVLGTPLRDLADTVIDRLPEGPPEDARRASRYTVVAEAHGTDGGVGRVVVGGSDVYGITAVIVVELARRVTAQGFGATGVLAPAQAVDPEDFLRFLGEHGVSYEVEGTPAAAGQSA